LPSKACSITPSTNSPSDMSSRSARAFITLTMRRSIRTPVWTRSICFMVHWYQGNVLPSIAFGCLAFQLLDGIDELADGLDFGLHVHGDDDVELVLDRRD